MKELKTKAGLILILLASACFVQAGCQNGARTDAPAPATPSPAASPSATPAAPAAPAAAPTPNETMTPAARDATPPAPADARSAVERVYKRAVSLDADASRAPVVGDFNGDGSEDIAVAVRPAPGMLAELNSEFANWVVVDPRRYGPRGQPVEPGPAKVEQRDTLLAIVHGYGEKGWRDPRATQSYLLRNAAGEGARAVPLKSFPPALKVKKEGADSRADVISEKLSGVAGFLYWAGGKYVWHEE
jgi:hypothetical protein